MLRSAVRRVISLGSGLESAWFAADVDWTADFVFYRMGIVDQDLSSITTRSSLTRLQPRKRDKEQRSSKTHAFTTHSAKVSRHAVVGVQALRNPAAGPALQRIPPGCTSVEDERQSSSWEGETG